MGESQFDLFAYIIGIITGMGIMSNIILLVMKIRGKL